MLFRNLPIRKKLMRVFFLTNAAIIFVTCITFFVYEFYAFKKTTEEHLSTIGKIIGTNSTAALAFENSNDAKDILAALKTEPHVLAAGLYDKNGKLFAPYHSGKDTVVLPAGPGETGYRFTFAYIEGFQPVILDSRQLGTLYLKSDLGALYSRLQLYGGIVVLVIFISFLLAYLLSKILQQSISKPIQSLAQTAMFVSDQGDYSHRAPKFGDDELGLLADSFNRMLAQIEQQNMDLNEFNQNLEQKVTERTNELQSVNKELESFSYSISHDLRAPLRAIIGFTSILEEDYTDKLDDEARRITGIIRNNTAKMGMLIDDLLAFSRMGRQNILKIKVDCDRMVREIMQELDSRNDTAKIEWVVAELPSITVDPNTMKQVWVNLISNAVKYSRTKEHPRIEIDSYESDNNIVFFVKDNGVGFDQQYQDKLFKVFQRLHRADEFEGTGVGLAIVERIVSKHGGRVWAEAAVGIGATFFFSLPVE